MRCSCSEGRHVDDDFSWAIAGPGRRDSGSLAFYPADWSPVCGDHALELDDLLGYAARLDVERVADELAHGTHAARVQEDFRNGIRSGVNGTPTFFVDGLRYDGPWDRLSLSGVLRGIIVPRYAQLGAT